MNTINNTLQKKQETLVDYLNKDIIINHIKKVVGKDTKRFISSIISATTVNPELKECSKESILSAALLGETLKLSPSPQLGQYYFVPFQSKYGKVAQFIIGYKGYLQLAIKTGFYKKINVIAIKEGELNYFDPLNEEIEVNIIKDYEAREEAKTIGYYAYLEYMNGFRKALYWSKSQMENHALKYSTSYNNDIQKGTKYSFWSSNFEAMAYKTMLRQLLSKWGNLNPEMQMAIDGDMAVIHQDGTNEYIDNIVINQDEKPKEVNNNIQNETIHNNQQMSIADALFS